MASSRLPKGKDRRALGRKGASEQGQGTQSVERELQVKTSAVSHRKVGIQATVTPLFGRVPGKSPLSRKRERGFFLGICRSSGPTIEGVPIFRCDAALQSFDTIASVQDL